MLVAQSRMPIILLILTIISLLSTLAAIIYTIIRQYIGFNMSQNQTYICTNYLTIKLQVASTSIFSMVFIFNIISSLLQLFIIIYLIKIIIESRQQKQIQQEKVKEKDSSFKKNIFLYLYLMISISIITIIPSAGYFMTYFIEKGIHCLSTIDLDQLLLSLFAGIALLLLLSSWIYLFKMQSQQKIILQENQKLSGLDTDSFKNIEKTSKNINPDNVLKQLMLANNIQKDNNDLRQQLLEQQIDQEDKISIEEKLAQKISFMTFQLFKKKQQQQQLKKLKKQAKIKQILQRQQKIAKIKQQEQLKNEQCLLIKPEQINSIPLSGNDPLLNEMFLKQQQQINQNHQIVNHQNKIEIIKEKIFYYPANYVPQTQQERIQFQKYKRQLLMKDKNQNKRQCRFKHPQNLTGGRSKKAMSTFINLYKRPIRNVEMYNNYTANPPNPYDYQIEEQPSIFSGSQMVKSIDCNIIKPKIVQNQAQKPLILQAKSTKLQAIQPSNEEEILYFHKTRKNVPLIKPLFQDDDYYDRLVNNRSILSSLTNPTESKAKMRLIQIRENRQKYGINNKIDKSGDAVKGERLIEYIRFKGQL